MEMFTVEFWVAFQMLIDLVLILTVLYFLRSHRSPPDDASKETAGKIIGMIEPLLKEADATAKAFENQLKEKNRLIRSLNETLDSRIISLNLLVGRAETCLGGSVSGTGAKNDIYDQQKAVLALFDQGLDSDAVAQRLSMPKREVDMVFELKRKFLKLERDIPNPGA
jgi:hypothetical protein